VGTDPLRGQGAQRFLSTERRLHTVAHSPGGQRRFSAASRGAFLSAASRGATFCCQSRCDVPLLVAVCGDRNWKPSHRIDVPRSAQASPCTSWPYWGERTECKEDGSEVRAAGASVSLIDVRPTCLLAVALRSLRTAPCDVAVRPCRVGACTTRSCPKPASTSEVSILLYTLWKMRSTMSATTFRPDSPRRQLNPAGGSCVSIRAVAASFSTVLTEVPQVAAGLLAVAVSPSASSHSPIASARSHSIRSSSCPSSANAVDVIPPRGLQNVSLTY